MRQNVRAWHGCFPYENASEEEGTVKLYLTLSAFDCRGTHRGDNFICLGHIRSLDQMRVGNMVCGVKQGTTVLID